MTEGVRVKVQIDAAAIAEKLGVLAGPMLRLALRKGLNRAMDLLAGAIQIGAKRRGLESRTGQLLNALAFWQKAGGAGDALTGYVGVPEDAPSARYAYLLTADAKTITPVNAKALTIPTGANMTGAGVARYPTVAALKAAFGDKVFFGGRFVGVRDETTPTGRARRAPRSQLYFILAQSVVVEGRDVIEPTAKEQHEAMTRTVQDEVDVLVRFGTGGTAPQQVLDGD